MQCPSSEGFPMSDALLFFKETSMAPRHIMHSSSINRWQNHFDSSLSKRSAIFFSKPVANVIESALAVGKTVRPTVSNAGAIDRADTTAGRKNASLTVRNPFTTQKTMPAVCPVTRSARPALV